MSGGLEQQVLRLAGLTLACGLDGVVCSAREAPLLRSRFGAAPVLVTPGIRPASAAPDDQRRTLTPAEALAAGSDYLVVGRPITAAADPAAALRGDSVRNFLQILLNGRASVGSRCNGGTVSCPDNQGGFQ